MRLSSKALAWSLVATVSVNGFSIHSPQTLRSVMSRSGPQNQVQRQSLTCLAVSTDEETPSVAVHKGDDVASTSDASDGVDGTLDEEPWNETDEEEQPYEVVLPVYDCDVPIGQYKVETTHDGPSGGPVHTLTVNMGRGEEPLVLVTGRIGRQTAGAITLTRGDTVLYSTCAYDEDAKTDIDFLPLSVEHQERFSSIGTTSGSYNKRDGRPAEHEILTCRLIDRPIRPLIAKGWRHETQLLNWVLSFDGKKSSDPLAMTNAAASLYISDVPLLKPVAAVNVGYINEEYVMNPTLEQMEHSQLHLTVAGTVDGVLMIEGAAEFLPEAVMIGAVAFGHECIKELCVAIEAFGKAVGKEKRFDTIIPPPEGLQERVDELFTERVDAMWSMKTTKKLSGAVMGELYAALPVELGDEFPGEIIAIKSAFKDLLCRRMFLKAKESGTRCDGRTLTEIRQLSMEAGILPRVHGSALFTRGETQCIATATLGDSGMKQKIERVDGNEIKRFYLQYTFPPSCVGETGRVGMPGRREVGHGNLAERYVYGYW
jgi:polyribonucleotide nucleotidyltransferase